MIFLGILAFVIIPVAIWEFCRLTTEERVDELRSIITHGTSGFYSIAVIIFFYTCLTRILPGEVGVVVDMMGNTKGVEDKELTVGVHFVLPWQSVYHFPIFEQNHQWVAEEGFNFQTSEGLSVHADIGITYNLNPEKVHDLFWRYRRGMDEITHLFIRNNIRDAINRASSKMKIEELYGEKKDEFFNVVHAHVQHELKDIGFNISHIFIIGQFKVPPIVMEALNRKIEATQKAQQRENELRETEAQARKQVAEAEGAAKSKVLTARANADSLLIEAKAKAEANMLLTKSISGELVKWESVNKWDGKMPKFVGSSNGVMFKLPFDEESEK